MAFASSYSTGNLRQSATAPRPSAAAVLNLGGQRLPSEILERSLRGQPLPCEISGGLLGGQPLPSEISARILGGQRLPSVIRETRTARLDAGSGGAKRG